MKTITLNIENLKCGGCENTVNKALEKLPNIKDITTNAASGEVTFSYKSEEDLQTVINRLNELGYPADPENNNIIKKAQSYVSCMIGRLS